MFGATQGGQPGVRWGPEPP